jgi:hypothetical protein
MPPKKAWFRCPRCFYEAPRKQQIQYHMNRTRICPAEKDDIELTDEIRNIVYNKRIYQPEDLKHERVDQFSRTVNNNNITNNNCGNVNYIMNIINTNFTPLRLVDTFSKCKQISLIPFEDFLNEKFKDKQNELSDQEKISNIEMRSDDFLDIIGMVSSVTDINYQDMNLFYDDYESCLNIYDDNVWKTSIIGNGLKMLVEKLKTYLFDYYECNLINKIATTHVHHEKQRVTELLEEYYSFIATFDVRPYVYNQSDCFILNNVTDMEKQDTAQAYTQQYVSIKEKLKPSHVRAFRKSVLDIIKKKSSIWLQVIKNVLANLAAEDKEVKQIIDKMVVTNPQVIES